MCICWGKRKEKGNKKLIFITRDLLEFHPGSHERRIVTPTELVGWRREITTPSCLVRGSNAVPPLGTCRPRLMLPCQDEEWSSVQLLELKNTTIFAVLWTWSRTYSTAKADISHARS